MIPEENGPAVPELARRITLTGCDHDPVRQLAATLLRMASDGIPPGDIIDDSGYAHRDARAWAIPLRNAGAQLVQDLHPHDRGPKGAHHGAVIANGNLYCPQTPRTLLELAPPPPGASGGQVAAHDQQAAELARHKLGRHAADDADGYHRVICPAAMGKIRCPLRPASMTLTRDRPKILTPPEHPPACCTQQTITVPPEIAAKTRQKHDYPSPQWRQSYQRRTAAERVNATIKDTATTSIARGWCRSPYGSPACWQPVTSASSPPGTPGSKTTPAAPLPPRRPAPANGAAPASPSSPAGHNHPAPPAPSRHAPAAASPPASTARARSHPCTGNACELPRDSPAARTARSSRLSD